MRRLRVCRALRFYPMCCCHHLCTDTENDLSSSEVFVVFFMVVPEVENRSDSLPR